MSINTKLTLESRSEDTIQCLFFSTNVDASVSLWKTLCENINNTIKTLSRDYIWQRDVFQVYIPITENEDIGIPVGLCSTTCFGDNIEDEWYIVYLILEISRLYNDIIIQISDNDGDFLLIEAADCLPSWANPSTTENRVFIFNSHIHLIPPDVVSLQTKLELKSALKIMSESAQLTQASYDIEQAILNRIGKYPEKLLESIHTGVVKLPSKLGALLILKPALIAPIVDAYTNHDSIDAKCCKNVDFSECVTINVKFTKFLYAALIHSKLIHCVKKYVSEHDKKSVLGLKLMCGFQMITSKPSTDLFESKDFYRFVDNLKQNGYFKNNIEGSKDYQFLLNNAKEYFQMIESPMSTHVSHNISQLMSTNEYLEIKQTMKDKYVVAPECTGDSEDWLNINPGELNERLLNRYGKTLKLKNNDVISAQSVTTELSSFLKQTSDYEGIEPSNNNEMIEDDSVDFESDKFVSCIEKMLKLLSTGCDDNSDSEDNDEMYNDVDDDLNDISELKTTLQLDAAERSHDSNTILDNIMESMKQEKVTSGPTTNLLRTVGIHKADLLDSDDEVD